MTKSRFIRHSLCPLPLALIFTMLTACGGSSIVGGNVATAPDMQPNSIDTGNSPTDGADNTGGDTGPNVTDGNTRNNGVEAPDEPFNIMEALQQEGQFNTLISVLQSTELDTLLSDTSRQLTLFAPSDAAFEQLPANELDALLDDQERLRNLLLYHVLIGEFATPALSALAQPQLDSAADIPLTLTVNGDNVRVNDVPVRSADLQSGNGFIHVIDRVLIPEETLQPTQLDVVETIASTDNLSIFSQMITASALDTILTAPEANFTIFAPSDEAFDELDQNELDSLLSDPVALQDIVLYHVISNAELSVVTFDGLAGTTLSTDSNAPLAVTRAGDDFYINLSRVISADLAATNGIVHTIDTILTPAATTASAGTIMNLLSTDTRFSMLTAGLQATLLAPVLDSTGSNFTVFAPTDAAFAALGSDAANEALGDTALLLGHLLPSVALDSVSAFAASGTSLVTPSGSSLELQIVDNTLRVNNAAVIEFDLNTDNGVVHVIDAVIQ